MWTVYTPEKYTEQELKNLRDTAVLGVLCFKLLSPPDKSSHPKLYAQFIKLKEKINKLLPEENAAAWKIIKYNSATGDSLCISPEVKALVAKLARFALVEEMSEVV